MTGRWVARNLGTVLLACAASAFSRPALACVCVNEPVAIRVAKGRVFNLDGPSGPEAIPGAAVELRRKGDHLSIGATTTGPDGAFELEIPSPGEYLLAVSCLGFQTAEIPLRITTPRPAATERLLVRLDIPTACTCGDACVAKPDRSGRVAPKCLVERK